MENEILLDELYTFIRIQKVIYLDIDIHIDYYTSISINRFITKFSPLKKMIGKVIVC